MNNVTQILEEVNTGSNPIAYRVKPNKLNPIANRMSSTLVDNLLQDYADLIDTRYTQWFAKRFYTMQFDIIHRAASEARNDGKNPQRLFAHLIKKYGTLDSVMREPQ